MEWTHRVYGKLKTEKRFRPMDLKAGRPVVNLIYATCFDETEGTKAVQQLNTDNPEWTFELRKI